MGWSDKDHGGRIFDCTLILQTNFRSEMGFDTLNLSMVQGRLSLRSKEGKNMGKVSIWMLWHAVIRGGFIVSLSL